jgi:glycosyltransferase involved in cell wall biosynthesis
MNILMITTSYPRTPTDGSAPFIAAIAEGIAKLGHNVDVILPHHPLLKEKVRNGVSLHTYRVPGDETNPSWGYAQSLEADVRLKKRVYPLALLAMHRAYHLALKVAKKNRPDLVHAHWVLPNGFIGARLSKTLAVPLVVSLHGSDMYLARKKKIFGSFARWVLKRAKAVTACSPDLQEQAEQLSKRDVALTEYGVDVNLFSPGGEPQQGTVLAVGRLVHKKGFVELLHAFAQIFKYYKNSSIEIIGDGPLLDALRDKASQLGLSERVKLPGSAQHSDLPELYRRAEIVAVPSITDLSGNRDGLPNVLLEALASGCAVIASDIPGIRNVINDHEDGLLVRSGDIDSLSNAMVELFRNPSLRERLGIAARQRAANELSWDVKCKQLEGIYLNAKNANI